MDLVRRLLKLVRWLWRWVIGGVTSDGGSAGVEGRGWEDDMRLFDYLGSLISKEAKQRARIPIAKDHDLTGRTGVAAVPEQHYVQLLVGDLFLKKNTEWFRTRYPLVYSLIALTYGDQPKREFSNVSVKNKFQIAQTDLNHSILRNYPLTPLIPYRGGDVEIDLGLVSMVASDMIESFAKTVSEVAGALQLSQVSQIANLSSTVADAVQSLLGAGKSETRLAVHDLLQSSDDGRGSLVSGYVLLSGREADAFKDIVWMTDQGVRTGTRDDLHALDGQDYLVLEVRLQTTRGDWQSLSAIGKPLDDAIEAKLKGQAAEAKALLVQATMAAIKSSDLTRVDAARVVAAINKYFADQTAIMQTVTAIESAESVGGSTETKSILVEAPDATHPLANVMPNHLGAAIKLFGDEDAPPLEELIPR